VYSPPPQWTATQRSALANSILVEYKNTFDGWFVDNGGVITDIDAMMQMTKLAYSGPGSWNDADMLQLCTYGEGQTPHTPGGMTLAEYRSHYSVWAVLASPLILSADLRTLKERHPECLALMLNEEIVAVNQDPLGAAPRLISQRSNASSIGQGLLSVSCTNPAATALPWRLEADGSLRVTSGNVTMCLDAWNCGKANGTLVDVYACHPGGKSECGYTNQQWLLDAKHEVITNVNSGSCLTVNESNPSMLYLKTCAEPVPAQQRFALDTGGLLRAGGAGSDVCIMAEATVTSRDIVAQVFARPLHGGGLAVVLLNRDESTVPLAVTWEELGVAASTRMAVRDVANRRDLPPATGRWEGSVGKHDVAFLRLTPLV